MSKTFHTYQDLTARVTAMQKGANTDALAGQTSLGVSHPEVPKHPDGDDPKKLKLPPSGENQENGAGLPAGSDLEIGPTGTATPKTKVEPAISANIDKSAAAIAKRAAEIAKRAGAAPATTVVDPPKTASGAPAVPPPAVSVTTPAAKTAASDVDKLIQFDNQFLRKLANAIFETEGGVEMAENLLARAKGREEVAALIKDAANAHAELVQAQNEELSADAMMKRAEAEQARQQQEAFNAMSPEQKRDFTKFATAHEYARASVGIDENAHFLRKMAYAQGAEDGQAMMDSQGGDPNAEPVLPGSQGGDPSAGGAQASLEEIAQALMLLVQTGEIDEATAQQVMQDLAAGGQGGAGAPPEGGEAPPPEMPPGTPPEAAEGAKMAHSAVQLFKKLAAAPAAPAPTK